MKVLSLLLSCLLSTWSLEHTSAPITTLLHRPKLNMASVTTVLSRSLLTCSASNPSQSLSRMGPWSPLPPRSPSARSSRWGPRCPSASYWRASFPLRSPALTLMVLTLVLAPTTETSCWPPQQISFAPPTSQRARHAPSPLDPESTEAETPSCSAPLSPSPASSCPSSREPSGLRPQSQILLE